jgi:lipopolysaccharide/colanic/teichoic acid biosynthesis glycosyltransferase
MIAKRLVDFTTALLGLLVLSLLLLVLWIVVRIKHGSPVLFCQQRPGLHSTPFTLYKFRTMTDARDSKGNLLPDEQRMTAFGKFMRSTSLDELPTLINVLKGEMSLVGPRPLLMDYLPLYSSEQARRHDMRPGITGWAQINGRNTLSWEEKFKLDVWYVDNHSLWLDLKILWFTGSKVLKRDGICQEGTATVEKFKGSNPKVENG